MTKLLIGTAFAAALALTPALAQTTQQAPATTPDARPTAPGTTTTPPAAPGTTAPGATGDRAATAATSAEDISASRLIGSTIRNAANETIGDINDVVLDNSGRVKAVIAGVGGFLGIGEHNVALRFEQMQMSRDSGGRPFMLSTMTREQLKALPEWRDTNATTTRAR